MEDYCEVCEKESPERCSNSSDCVQSEDGQGACLEHHDCGPEGHSDICYECFWAYYDDYDD